MAAVTGTWGTPLNHPAELTQYAVLTAFADAFAASQAFADGEITELVAQQERIPANFTPPDGYFFAHTIEGDDSVQITTLQEDAARQRSLHRDMVHLGGLGLEGSVLLGDRL